MSPIIWFDDSPDAGDPACICSWCGQPIKSFEESGEVPVRAFRGEGEAMKESRFHSNCFYQAFEVEGVQEASS